MYDGFFRFQYRLSAELSWLGTLEARNPDGSGNNLANPDWGVAHGTFVRVTPNSYLDGIGTLWDLPVQRTDGPPFNPLNMVGTAPRPREISDRIMAQPLDAAGNDRDIRSTAGINEYFQFFGQFLTHDVAEADVTGTEQPLFVDGLPFPFARTPFEIGSDAHNTNVRQQLNDESSYLDLSQVYGSKQEIEDLLRATDGSGRSAYMLTGANGVLPTYQQVAADKGLTAAEVIAVLDPLGFGVQDTDFAAGDNRANQQTHLLTHHMVWLRNHNWHVDQLRDQFPGWSEEQLFEAARALNEAEWQHVVYDEYMSKLIGEDAIAKYSGYKTNVDASVINEWTTVAFRFGHDESSNDLSSMGENGQIRATVTLGEAFNLAADGVRDDAGLSEWVRGQLARVTQEIDGKVVTGNRNVLFGIPGATVDLEVFDIQRGRDHGVGRYNALREGLGFDAYDSFEDFASDNRVDAATLAALKDIYDDDIDALDSIVGGLLEREERGSLLGETFTLLNVMQFEAFRDGDRFFYLNRLDADLIRMVDSTSLADIIARNTDIGHVYRDAFLEHKRIGGTDRGEIVTGTLGRDLLIGFKGADQLFGLLGNDDLRGDEGADYLYGGLGHDVLYGGADRDRLYGGLAHDFLSGDNGDDDLWGELGDDFLFGGAGKDKLYGNLGNDYLDGGTGDDGCWGGLGRDIFAFGEGAGRDSVHDFNRSADRLDLTQLDFASLAEVRAACVRSGRDTLLTLDDEGGRVRLVGVNYQLEARHVILDDNYVI